MNAPQTTNDPKWQQLQQTYTLSYRIVNRPSAAITHVNIMGRKKIQIKKIEDQKLKTITFTRRRNGLLKKAYELSVLCDTRVCVLMFDSKDMCHVYSSVKEDKDGEELMQKFISKSFTTVDPRRKYDTSPDLQLDETSTPWRVTTQENNVAIVNTYSVQPSGIAPTTPGGEGASPGDEEDDGDGLDQLSVKFSRSYHVNKGAKKSPRKGSVQAHQGMTPPASTTFSPPMNPGQFLSPGDVRIDPLEYPQHQYEGLGIAGGMVPAGYTFGPVPHYITSPNMQTGQLQPQYLRSPMQMMTTAAGQPLQQLQGNPHIQRSPARMVPVMQPISPMAQQGHFQAARQGQQGAPPRLVRQQTQPLPRHLAYDENTMMQAALLSQMRQQQNQQLHQEYLSPPHIPQSPQRAPKPISRSVPSSPEKRRYANQLAQVSELDILSIPNSLMTPTTAQTRSNSGPDETKPSHLRGISFLDELFGAPAEPKGPLAPDGTLREDDAENPEEYDEAALEADVNAWLEGSGDLVGGTEWLDQVVLN